MHTHTYVTTHNTNCKQNTDLAIQVVRIVPLTMMAVTTKPHIALIGRKHARIIAVHAQRFTNSDHTATLTKIIKIKKKTSNQNNSPKSKAGKNSKEKSNKETRDPQKGGKTSSLAVAERGTGGGIVMRWEGRAYLWGRIPKTSSTLTQK